MAHGSLQHANSELQDLVLCGNSHVGSSSLMRDWGSNPGPWLWEHRVLTTGPPGKPQPLSSEKSFQVTFFSWPKSAVFSVKWLWVVFRQLYCATGNDFMKFFSLCNTCVMGCFGPSLRGCSETWRYSSWSWVGTRFVWPGIIFYLMMSVNSHIAVNTVSI